MEKVANRVCEGARRARDGRGAGVGVVRDAAQVDAGSGAGAVEAVAGATEAQVDVRAACDGRGPCTGCGRCFRAGAHMSIAGGAPADVLAPARARWLGGALSLASFTSAFAPLPAERFGVAVDVGTTTIVARLYDMAAGEGECVASAARPNAQARFGVDVISRLAACKAGHQDALTAVVRASVSEMITDLLVAAGADASTAAPPVYLCGNTIMEHLFAGVDPTPIGLAPFTPPFARDFPCETSALTLAPCVAGYVGGDVVCDLLALDLAGASDIDTPTADAPTLLIDLGTNGEIALATPRGVFACATAAGPVFEGAQIACGMPAYTGAVSAVARTADGLHLETVGDVSSCAAVGICGSGLVDALALMLAEGVIDTHGRWTDRTLPAEQRRFALTPGVYVTQRDVRAFQLARAAIAAGTRVLLDAAGCAVADVARVYVAGGMGAHLNLANAARVGLIPPELLERTLAVGNAAIEGASLALMSAPARAAARRLAEHCTYVELSGNPAFNAAYLAAMDF